MHTYIRSEPQLFTVGRYAPDGEWVPMSDHDNEDEAIFRVATLNGAVTLPPAVVITMAPDDRAIILAPFTQLSTEGIVELCEQLTHVIGTRFAVLNSDDLKFIKLPPSASRGVQPPVMVVGDPDDESTWRLRDTGEPFDRSMVDGKTIPDTTNGILVIPPSIIRIGFGEASPRGRFGPLAPDHPGVGQICPLCLWPLKPGQVPALVTTGPADGEEAAKALAGRAYNAEAQIVHEACAW